MSRIVYVNGEYVPEEEAKISVFDRGFLMGDGVYEVSSILDGKLVDNDAHLARLERSLNELNMGWPCTKEELVDIQREVIRRNDVEEGAVYWQITRGAADRDFVFPKDAKPSLVMFTQARKIVDVPAAKTGMSVITVQDIRWHRRDIKTVQLLAPSLAKMEAKAAGADDAWLVEDGYVTEGSSNNAFIITQDGTIVTRKLSNDILHGITRRAVLKIAEQEGLKVEERSFTPDEAYDAAEAFITSASAFVMPVVKIDNRILGNGVPGPIASKLRELYIEMAKAEAK
ncbi:D-amino-acid transaminase [Rhodospirillaceae bacterium KN72]|uniref:Probable branched-chain-amino-acid aminotransferase n=1 Tax=Pacificispira spongiicola TaxID=2729598 RepID=A0A7Y0HHG4_9PROT|nr:D-amino-acid transaminase [Pacificispira spongiicola]NMM45892.1 D-amino-acid transaminase [Pacificispira spongiicola]